MKSKPTNLTNPEHWAEWFDKCALALCGAETKKALGGFAYQRYKSALNRALGVLNRPRNFFPAEAQELLASEDKCACWYDLEASYWHGGRELGAKAYKKFCREFAASTPTEEEARNYLEGYAAKYLVWSRCRTIISQSIPRVGGVTNDSNQTSEDLILEKHAEPASDASSLDSELRAEAEKIFAALSEDERILFLAKANNIPLNHPEIENRLGQKKSVLYNRQAATKQKVARLLGISQAGGGHSLDSGKRLVQILELLHAWALSPECGIGDCLMDDGTQP